MILPDVNIVVYAIRKDSRDHVPIRNWLEAAVNSQESFGLSDLVLSGAARILTHPKIFSPPTPIEHVVSELDRLRDRPNCINIGPGPRHWSIFTSLCLEVGARGNLIPDAFLAAIAIESGSLLVTTDRDFARFPGLKWDHPLRKL